MKYVIQYTLPYEHRVQVGITADNRGEALATAETLFDRGDIWQDSEAIPLLFDDYEEVGDAPLVFTVEQETAAEDPWPESDASVLALRRREAAFEAARLLVEAYRLGEQYGGSVAWDDLDQAYAAARRAVGYVPSPERRQGVTLDQRLAIVMEGGAVQAVISDRPGSAPAIAVIDYDVEGVDPGTLRHIAQADGHRALALVTARDVEPAAIDLDAVFVVMPH